MRRILLLLLVALILAGCATQPVWQSSINAERMGVTPKDVSPPTPTTSAPYRRVPPDGDPVKDKLECQALAGQAAAGAGGWTSVAPVRSAIYDKAKQQYYDQCLYSRGYRWIQP